MLPRRILKPEKRASRWRSQALNCHALRGVLRYEAGKLFWLERPRAMIADQRSFKTWNARFAGQEAFTAKHSEGYRCGTIFGCNFFAHQIIWALHFGDAPGEIDHINGNRADNRLENLRAVSRDENRRNVKRPSTNSSGVVGVYRMGSGWRASIGIDGRSVHLGNFTEFDQACTARKLAEVQYGFHENHGRSDAA
ncbi:MAG: HNH endonuclease [Sphingobium sp.]|nr:HNH endonuclease [Sphingobium sp.]